MTYDLEVIARNYAEWVKHVDPDMNISAQEFEEMSIEAKMEMAEELI